MEWFFLDLAIVNFVKRQLSLGEFMFFNRVFEKCQITIWGCLDQVVTTFVWGNSISCKGTGT